MNRGINANLDVTSGYSQQRGVLFGPSGQVLYEARFELLVLSNELYWGSVGIKCPEGALALVVANL